MNQLKIDPTAYFNLLKVFNKSIDLVHQLDEWLHQESEITPKQTLPKPIVKSLKELKSQLQSTTESGLKGKHNVN